ncbi:hypothetical protein F4775DRAFT_318524 [Biscogniauxia sp. FL1348]|nr:hypothetical protein F4775DRAFT_318524 [Biscogniauxia sp. FL1348]
MSSSTAQHQASSTTPPKKFTRSQSPRAKERRRLQNRIAQRNHRRKLKERAACADGNLSPERQSSCASESSSRSGSIDQSSSSSFSGIMDTTFMADGLPNGASPIWPALDPTMGMQVLGTPGSTVSGTPVFRGTLTTDGWSHAALPAPAVVDASSSDFNPSCFMPLSHDCTCNGMTGPCVHHIDEFRDRLMGMMTGSPCIDSSPRVPTIPAPVEDAMMMQPMAFEANSSIYDMMQHEPRQLASGTPPRKHSRSISSPFCDTPPHGHDIQTMRGRRRTVPVPMSPSNGTIATPPYTPEDVDCSPDPAMMDPEIANSTATNTVRFKALLDIVRNFGFQDFDSMVSAYYTAQFQRNSVPDMSQRASRSRRLHRLLQDLHESSKRWTKWESRGLREGVMESARDICVNEIERVAQGRRWAEERYDPTMLDGLGISHGSNMATDSGCDPHLAGIASSSYPPISDETAFQDNAPSLWSLLTELAGTDGLQCDRVSQEVLTSLLQARIGLKTDLDPFLMS